MEADKKLEGASYHLGHMKEAYQKDEKAFIYELEAFLVKLRSVPDVILEDFNEKFGLGIGLEGKITPEIFRKKARQLNNSKAMDFIHWWEDEMRRMRTDELGRMLFEKRNISVHRKVVRPDLAKITVYDNICLTDSVTVTKYDKNGKLIEEWKSPETPPEPIECKPAEVDWCFSEFPNKNVLEVSELLLQMVKEFIEKAKNQFMKKSRGC